MWFDKGEFDLFPQPLNKTNHNAMDGPVPNLFVVAKKGKVVVEKNSPITSPELGSLQANN